MTSNANSSSLIDEGSATKVPDLGLVEEDSDFHAASCIDVTVSEEAYPCVREETLDDILGEYHDVPLVEGTVTEAASLDAAVRCCAGATESSCDTNEVRSVNRNASATSDSPYSTSSRSTAVLSTATLATSASSAAAPALAAAAAAASPAALRASPSADSYFPPILAAAFSLFPSSPSSQELPSSLSPPDLSPPLSPSREAELEAPGGTIGGSRGGAGGSARGRAAGSAGAGEADAEGVREAESRRSGSGAGEGGGGSGERGRGGEREVEESAEAGGGRSGGEGEGKVASGEVYWSAAMVVTDPLGSVQCPNFDVEQVRAVASRLLPAIAAAAFDQLENSMSLFSSPPSPLEAAEAVRSELLTFLDSRTKGLSAAAVAAAAGGVVTAVTGVTAAGAADVTEVMAGAWHGGGTRVEVSSGKGSGGMAGGAGAGGAGAVVRSAGAGQLQEAGKDPEPCNSVAVTAVQSLLDEFLVQRRTLLSRFSSAFRRVEYTEDKVASLVQELEESDLLDKELRINLAQSLIRRVDASGGAHCMAQFGTVAGLELHRGRCPFEEIPCVNTPCWERVSRYRMDVHDRRCPLKMLPCRQGCRLQVARAGMERHCETVCGMKEVPCPYAPMGCTLPLLQKDVGRHCRERVEGHLRAACQLIVEMRQAGQVVERRLDMLEKSISLAERSGKVDVEMLRKELQASNKKVSSLEQELHRVRGEARSATALKKDVSFLQEQLRKLQLRK